MDIQDLGSLGELIGGIAVVASVIYLTIQIRHGISGYRSQTILETTNHFSNLQLEIAKSDTLLQAWAKAERGEALEPLEARRVINIVSSYLIGFENMHAQASQGMMDQEAYDFRRVIIASLMALTGVWAWWQQLGKHQFPPAFAADVEKAVQEFNIEVNET